MKLIRISITICLLMLFSCMAHVPANKEMVRLLKSVAANFRVPQNAFAPEARKAYFDSLMTTTRDLNTIHNIKFLMGEAMLELGNETEAIKLYEELLSTLVLWDESGKNKIMKKLALSYLRYGEKKNCFANHTSESCIFPVSIGGVHTNRQGSERAVELYEAILESYPNDLESRWLLNIAYMTINGYPDKVPKQFLIKSPDIASRGVKAFIDVAVSTGLNKSNMAGGSIIDDFNNDGHLDLITSSWSLDEGMHFCRNNGNGTFTDVSDSSGLSDFTGGLQIVQTDYNNDGLKDVFVLRGGWKGTYGKEPNSLLKNNGDGTFTDVTRQSGLLSFHPTQTATWADFDNDGWLDVFIGNETSLQSEPHPCELYLNNRKGGFINIAESSKTDIVAYVKGVTSGDYNNDGFTDLFVSTLNGRKFLLQNEGLKNGKLQFKDVSAGAGFLKNFTRTFPTWFWDYDNDGWLDILVCGYEFNRSLAWYAAAEALGLETGNSGKVFLFRNKRDGSFEEVTEEIGLGKIAFAMGSNFGDIDNDGFLDIYLGTGNPQYESLVPNKMFKNIRGEKFLDITSEARVGSLQKGHGVAFADIDTDGDLDIYIDMGGAYKGDAYQNLLFINPGQNNNHWINLLLEGTKANRAAIGAKIKVTFIENGIERSVYRDVNSGGSFGGNPLLQHIGIGAAALVKRIEIKWPGSSIMQKFENLLPDQTVVIKENASQLIFHREKPLDFLRGRTGTIGCATF